jgi:long-chain acyl-CoA synthetase
MADTPVNSLADMLLRRVAETPSDEAYRYPSDGGWESLTWREVGERVRALACGLRALGLEDEQRCAILSTTRIEWILADLAILLAGGATTTIYPSSTGPDCVYILNDSESRIVFVEDAAQLAKLEAERDAIESARHAVLLCGEPSAHAASRAMSLAGLMERGRAWDARNPGRLDAIVAAVRRDSLATLVYTSGTTGRPKGVELVHDCWIYEAEAIDQLRLLRRDDLQYLWLPLSHIFGKVLEAAQIQIGFPTAVDGRVERMVENLAVVRPSFVAAVPRVFEKVRNRILLTAQEAGGLKQTLFDWAFGVGRRLSGCRQAGSAVGTGLGLKAAIAQRLVFSKIQARFGGRLRFFVSGSAPLMRDVAEFFHAAGILILEGYGLTETSAASCVNLPDRYRFGSVGPPLPGTEVRIAEDGEVLLRGRGMMRGYHRLPELTREALEPDGWLHTGDIGILEDGFVRITDRKKELIKTSGGKYVAPQAIEGKLKALCPYVTQVVVHGNNRHFCSALVTLDAETLGKWALERGLQPQPMVELVEQPAVRLLVQQHVDQLNAGLASFETIKRFAILPVEFTPDSGELTASLKIKRRVVEEKYRSVLDALYA